MSETYVFTLDAYTPDTIPMARLADYMAEIAKLMGHKEGVHFDALDTGSTHLAMRVDEQAHPKIHARLALVRQGEGPSEAMTARRALEEMLRADNAVGEMTAGENVVLTFRGRNIEVEEIVGPVVQHTELQGSLTRLGGRDATIHGQLVDADERPWNFVVDKKTAKEMSPHLFEIMRLIGKGRWLRNEAGEWQLRTFIVTEFQLLDTSNLRDVVTQLRRIEGSGWKQEDDPLELLEAIRAGMH